MMRENQDVSFVGTFSMMKVPEVADDYNYEDEDPDFEMDGLEGEENEMRVEREVVAEDIDCLEDLEIN